MATIRSVFATFLLSILHQIFAESTTSSAAATTLPPQLKSAQVYQQPDQPPIGYIPHQTYPYYDGYGPYDTFYAQPNIVKQPHYQDKPQEPNYMSAIIPATQGALQFALKVLAKFGLFLIGGAVLLLVGGIFTTAVCSLTPICIITFPGFTGLNKESVRSMMTPDKISAAAAMVQDAIGKYQRLQRAVSN